MPPPILVCENLSKHYGTFAAIHNVSFEVGNGEFVCFIGPSGCGKTTLLRTLAGLDRQTAGHIIHAGRDISVVPPRERQFGMVFQSYALFPGLTAFENIAYGPRARGLKRAAVNERVNGLLELVGMQEISQNLPTQLSGGQQQRIALARALANSPSLLLLDEPLSALDARVRVHLRHEIRALQRKLAITTIMVTHDQEEALTVADRILVMNRGVIEQVGTPFEIYGNPASPFVADFVGSMNFLEGTISGRDQVSIGLSNLTYRSETELACGTRVRIAIRPEDICIQGQEDYLVNLISARVTEMTFLGAYWRVSVLSDVLPNKLGVVFSSRFVQEHGIVGGSTLRVILPPERLHVFK